MIKYFTVQIMSHIMLVYLKRTQNSLPALEEIAAAAAATKIYY